MINEEEVRFTSSFIVEIQFSCRDNIDFMFSLFRFILRVEPLSYAIKFRW